MKYNPLSLLRREEDETIATFGQAKLARDLKGNYRLLGGTEADRAAAVEWCSMFMQEAVVSVRPGG